MNSFGERLTAARKRRGFSQKQLGDLIGVSNRVISKYERDEREPLVSVAFKLASALELSLDTLMGSELAVTDVQLLERLQKIDALPVEERNAFLMVIDRFLKK